MIALFVKEVGKQWINKMQDLLVQHNRTLTHSLAALHSTDTLILKTDSLDRQHASSLAQHNLPAITLNVTHATLTRQQNVHS